MRGTVPQPTAGENQHATLIVGDKGGVLILGDNQAVIKLVENPVFHKRSKHIAIKWHFIRERSERGEVTFDFVRTREMGAHMLTKHATLKVLNVGKVTVGMESA